MSDPAQVSPQSSPRQISLQQTPRKFPTAARRAPVVMLICCVIAQVVLADTVTYQQLQQRQEGRPRVMAGAPTVIRAQNQDQQDKQSQNPPAQSEQSQSGVAKESPDHPEFVRLPDGRIVRYGPGILCDENCVEPMTPAAFREPGPRWWWIVAPLVAGGILCAILCRPGGDSEPLTRATILIPSSQIASPTLTSTASPGATPPEQVPEPGTVFLFGSGLAALLLRKRMKAKANQQ